MYPKDTCLQIQSQEPHFVTLEVSLLLSHCFLSELLNGGSYFQACSKDG